LSRDAELRRLERRAAESPQDPGPVLELARAYLRAGHSLLALSASRGLDRVLQEEAAAALGARLGLTLDALEPSEVWRTGGGERLVLIPGGAFLDEGPRALRSSLEPGGERAPLARVEVGAFLISVLPLHGQRSAVQALLEEDRLPTFLEWKKSWRGGLNLDGDTWGRVPNPEPDRLRPAGLGSGGGIERSPYGVLFPLVHAAQEWCRDSLDWACALANDGRYQVPVGPLAALGARRVRPIDPLW
jgi:hypothetical protein